MTLLLFIVLLWADDPTNQKILMVLEYVQGGSLFAGTKISPKKRLSELQARKYFRDVLQVCLIWGRSKGSLISDYMVLISVILSISLCCKQQAHYGNYFNNSMSSMQLWCLSTI